VSDIAHQNILHERKRYTNNKPGRYALITISDAGAGMDKEPVSHIPQPFFTTKELGGVPNYAAANY
jgi:signal transduction histidine kinase